MTKNDTISTPLTRAWRSIRMPLVAVAAFSFFLNLLAFVAPLFMLQVYDRVLTSRNETTLVMLASIAIGLLVVLGLLEKYRHRVLVRASVVFDRLVAEQAFDASLLSGLRSRGSQHAQAVRDVDTLRDFIGGSAILTLMDAPWVPIYLGVCFMFHPLIGLVATGGAVVIFVLAWLNDRLTGDLLAASSKQNTTSLNGLTASLRNAEVIRALGMGPAMRRRWADGRMGATVDQVLANQRGGGLLSLSKFVRQALQVGILGVSAWLVLEGHVMGGVMFAASMIMGKALAPVEQAVAQWKGYVAARTAQERLQGVFKSFPMEQERMRLPAPKGNLVVENLVVAVPGTNQVLVRNASFAINAGEVVVVIGATGSGKSTLARALVGAWPAAAGSVRIDGNDLRHWNVDQIGSCIGYLPQDVELFAGTVAENVARFGEVDEARVVAAAQAASAHEVIQRLPAGYATAVGEEGVGLSGGQRQRVGLARALYGDPAVVVLDEPNANLDGDGDHALIQSVMAMKKAGKSVVIIAHKTNVLQVADKVMLMGDGMIRMFGPRDEVMAQFQQRGGRVAAAA